MKRIAFTIIYRGYHHLVHNGFADFMAANFDHWVVIEGHAKPNGSTSWCKNIRVDPRSTDGTHEFMMDFANSHTNVIYGSEGRYFQSKDEQVNAAILIVKLLANECYLWQVDVDEVWTKEKLDAAEKSLSESGLKTGAFQFNHFLCKDANGNQLVGRGEWGDNWHTRLWLWKGEKFVTHEPPKIENQGEILYLPQKYDHYSYFFEQDVKFKGMYYKGNEHVPKNWKWLQQYKGSYPLPITTLFGINNRTISRKSYIDILR